MTRRLYAALAGIVLLSACGGGSKGGSLPPASTGPQSKKVGTATFTLKIPSQATMTKLRRRYYQSQATQGVAIDWSSSNPAAPDYSAPISATCPGTLPAGVLTCGPDPLDSGTDYTFQLQIPAGTYPHFTVTTFDVAPSGGTFAGNMLAQGQLAAPVVITGGTSNTVPSLTFYGIPASVSFQPGPAQSHVVTYNGNLAVIGNAPQTFFAQAVDADGFVIDSTDSGAPAVTVAESASDSPQEFTVATTATPYEYTLTATNASANATIDLTATPGGTGLSAVTDPVVVTPIQEMWTTQAGGTPANFGLYGYPLYPSNSYDPANPIDHSDPQLCGGGECNWSWAAMAPNGNIWAIGQGYGLFSFSQGSASQGVIAPASASSIPLGPSPQGLAFDESGRLYLADSSSETITIYDSGTAAQLAQITGILSPAGIAVAPMAANVPSALVGSIWVGCSTNICAYTPYAGSTPTPISVSTDGTLSFAVGLAFDQSGNLWVYDELNGVISVYSIGGNATNASVSRVAVSPTLGGIDPPYGSYIGSRQLGVAVQGTGWIGGPGSLNGMFSFTESGSSLNPSSNFSSFPSVWSVMIAP
ncbi:MAG TPA: hypothetical protein VMV65_09135 [Alphaproteobacteria bacterium]|nr:hypothetical protein [Alphaproteobacteria bacterium]